jgi:GT2 family glycosyltransferase
MTIARRSISVVTPTFGRPGEMTGLLENLAGQTVLPDEILIVDGAPPTDRATEQAVEALAAALPYACRYIRRDGGTAVQRNAGIDRATGAFIAFVDDDIRLEPAFLETMIAAFDADTDRRIGGLAGYITNQYFDMNASPRWRWYRRLRLFTTYEPGRYDFGSGYPINRYGAPPHESMRPLDFMGAGCAVWRRQVFDAGLRFSEFFRDYGMLEDAHLALRARQRWQLFECGAARCVHLRATAGRPDPRSTARKTAVNYRFVFVDIVSDRTWTQEFRFWRMQLFELARFTVSALRHPGRSAWAQVLGKAEGIVAATRVRPARVLEG